jgi:hypothetical protein
MVETIPASRRRATETAINRDTARANKGVEEVLTTGTISTIVEAAADTIATIKCRTTVTTDITRDMPVTVSTVRRSTRDTAPAIERRIKGVNKGVEYIIKVGKN